MRSDVAIGCGDRQLVRQPDDTLGSGGRMAIGMLAEMSLPDSMSAANPAY